MNAVRVTFGKASPVVERFSKKAVDEAGLSMQNFNQLVVPVGAMLQNVGYSQRQAADEAVNLAKRAADMASVFNTDVPSAMGAIQAAMRGEADPIERYGVGLNEAAVAAQAMAMGLAKDKSKISVSAKAQARLALLYKQTDKFAGDFKNTSGGLANQQRIMRERYANLQAEIGTKLLPVMVTFIGLINRLLGSGTRAKVVLIGLAVAFGVLQVATAIATIANMTFTASMLPWLAIPLLIIAIGVAFVVLYKKVGWFRKAVDAVWKWIKTHWPLLLPILLGPFGLALMLVIKNFDKIKKAVRSLVDFVRDMFGRIKGPLESAMKPLEKAAGFAGKIGGVAGKIPGFAYGGTMASPGLALVGERGPEVVHLPGGATVQPIAAGALSMGGAFGSADITTRVYVDKREVARAVGHYTADKIARR
jgi:hypothetical protein